MAKPGDNAKPLPPLTLPAADVGGVAQVPGGGEIASMYVPVHVEPVVTQDAPLGAAAARPVSPGVARTDKLDPEAHARLQVCASPRT